MSDYLKEIPLLRGSELLPIHEGYSADQKFIARKGNSVFLVRTFNPSDFPAKQKEFSVLEKMAELKVKCSRPLDLGKLKGGSVGYVVLSFVEGDDGAKALPHLSNSEQYEIGIQAGQELRKINSWTAPHEVPAWHERKLAKHRRYVDTYINGSVQLSNGDKLIRFIDEHTQLMKGRPNLFQHDDFHIRNLVVKDSSLAGVIDFGRHDWGDPIHEFLKVGQFSTEVSVPFSVGQIRGYFEGSDPDENFWELYSLYSAMSFFSFIVWTNHVCPNDMARTLDILKRVGADHRDFEMMVPKWYSGFRE